MEKNMYRIVLAVFFASAVAMPALADEGEVIRLICNYHSSLTVPGGEPERLSGKDLITVTRIRGNFVEIVHDGGVLYGEISREAIRGESTYESERIKLDRTLYVNRYTGEFERTLSSPGKSLLITSGACQKAIAPLF